MKKPCDAKYYLYGDDRHVIHVVGPDFRQGTWTEPLAVDALTAAYRNVFREYVGVIGKAPKAGDVELPPHTLRLLPVSGGIFSGPFGERIPRMTWEALVKAYLQLREEERAVLLGPNCRSVNLCVYDEKEVHSFLGACRLQSKV